MITMTNGLLRSQAFTGSLRKLSAGDLPFKTAYQIKKIGVALSKKLDEIQKDWATLATELCVKDEAGNLKIDESGRNLVFKEGVDPKDAFDKFVAFDAQEFTIDLFQLTPEMLESAKISAAEVDTLSPLIAELPLAPLVAIK